MLTKKTTILFSPELHQHLLQVAAGRGTSLGELVRRACVAQYGDTSVAARRAAVARMAELALPVSDVQTMKRESVPDPAEL